jgi:hypothetical protein
MTPDETFRDLERRCAAHVRDGQAVRRDLWRAEFEVEGLRDENVRLKARLLVAEGLAKRSWLRRLLSWK